MMVRILSWITSLFKSDTLTTRTVVICCVIVFCSFLMTRITDLTKELSVANEKVAVLSENERVLQQTLKTNEDIARKQLAAETALKEKAQADVVKLKEALKDDTCSTILHPAAINRLLQ